MTPELWSYVDFFRQSEFDSPDSVGSNWRMSARLIFRLVALRLLVGKPFIINSGFRTPERNHAVGGAPHSAHLTGEAVDVRTRGWTHRERIDFIVYARKLGFNGVGIAAGYIHIDIQPRDASWVYVVGGQKAIKVGSEAQYV